VALTVALLLQMGGCGTGVRSVSGWRALQPGVDIGLERGDGPDEMPVLSVVYTAVPGHDYAIERAVPAGMGRGEPEVHLRLQATRVLHLAVVLVDKEGLEHQAVRTLAPGHWRDVRFDGFCPPIEDGVGVRAMRLVDRTGGLGGQGPVSLKLVDLPLDSPAWHLQ
jgi:hypothetical protein